LESIIDHDSDKTPNSTEIYKKYLRGVCHSLTRFCPDPTACYAVLENEHAPEVDSPAADFWQLFFKITLAIYMDDYESAEAFFADLRRIKRSVIIPRVIENCLIFYKGIVAAVMASRSSGRQHCTRLRLARRQLQKLQSRQSEGDPSLWNKAFLVEAQIQACLEQHETALLLFHQSCKYSDRQGFFQEQGLAYELAGKMCRACHREDESDLYLSQAQADYGRWGALAKVAQLDRFKSSNCNRTQSTCSF
jgi:hypothetical protein